MTSTHEELELLFADICRTPALDGDYDSYFISFPNHSPKSKVCNKLVDFCTLLLEYLILEGYDAEYKPCTGYPSHPQQTLWIYLSRADHNLRAVVVDVDRSSIQHGCMHHKSVGALMASLKDEMLRYQNWVLGMGHCYTCTFSNDSYIHCGVGAEMYTGNCTQREVRVPYIDIIVGGTTV